MYNKTKGYLLLVLLVLTGLAGRLSVDTISAKERSFLVNELKESKELFLKSIENLSEEQWNYKADASKWSVKECAQHITLSEAYLSKIAETTLKAPANAQLRTSIKYTDADIITLISNRNNKAEAPESIQPNKALPQKSADVLNTYKHKRNELIKYAKTTTDDMRNHVYESNLGPIDSYQLLLMLSAHTRRHTGQIEEIKASAGFPK